MLLCFCVGDLFVGVEQANMSQRNSSKSSSGASSQPLEVWGHDFCIND